MFIDHMHVHVDEPPEFNFTFTRLSVEDRNTTNFEAVFEYQVIISVLKFRWKG